MKGLLLKDWYLTIKYCKAYLFLVIFFSLISVFSDGNVFFLIYPCLMCSIIPVNLFAYDERSHWLQYSDTMPYKREDVVMSKYLIGLLIEIPVIILSVIIRGVKMAVAGSFDIKEIMLLLLALLTVSTVFSSFSLPFVFKYGVEKGRIFYYVMIGVASGLSVALNILIFNFDISIKTKPFFVFIILCLVSVSAFIISCTLSKKIYKNREL